MAGVSRIEEEKLSQHVYSSLLAVSCPLVEHLDLQEAGSMLQLLCTPSQLRTEILTWICSRIKPDCLTSKELAVTGPDPDAVTREMAVVGQELMLCTASDLKLIRGEVKPLRQLQFLQQLLAALQDSAEQQEDGEELLEQLFSSQNLPLLSRMLQLQLPPQPADVQKICDELRPPSRPAAVRAAELESVLQSTRSELQRLQSQCDFSSAAVQATVFSPESLRVAAVDLQQLMSTFSHVFESDLKAHCGRTPPGFSADCHVFQRVEQLLLRLNLELEMFKETSAASSCMTEEVERLRTNPEFWGGEQELTLPEQLEALRTQISDYVSMLESSRCGRTHTRSD